MSMPPPRPLRSMPPCQADHHRRWLIPRGVAALLRIWRRRARERDELRGLSDRDLQDFGMSRSEALGEAVKPFWRE